MGAPAYPKWVWSYYGGWYAHPKNYLRNTVATSGILLGLASLGFVFSSNIETRHQYPNKWIPSMLWSRDFHDPKFVAMWKEQLKKEGRAWIEPIPDWWPFKKNSS